MADPAKTPPSGDDNAAITFAAGAPDIGPAIEAVRRLVEDHTTAKQITLGKHRAVFPFPLSDEWKAWQEQDKKPMSMIDFAAFLEDRIVDVLDMIPGEDSLPEDMQKFVNAIGGRIASPSRLLELSVGLKVHEKAAVSEAVNLASGEAQIQFVSEHVDASGAPLKVPNLFLIGIPVFRNGQFYRLAARLRYRKSSSGLLFWYDLWRADRVFDHAFRDGCERARVETDLPLLFGTPE